MRPSLVSIQTYLLLAIILQNDMQPEASWAIIGTTRALVQIIDSQAPTFHGQDSVHVEYEESALVSQETMLAMCLGTLPISLLGLPNATQHADGMNYTQCMRGVLEALPRSYKPSSEDLDVAITAVEAVGHRAVHRLLDRDQCRSIQDRIEYFDFRIQTNFVITSLLVIRKNDFSESQPPREEESIASQCRTCCVRIIRGFLEMHNFTIIPVRTWRLLYAALASALLLRFVGEQDGEVKELQQSLYEVLFKFEEDGGPVPGTAPLFRNRYTLSLDLLRRWISHTGAPARMDAQDRDVDTNMWDSCLYMNESKLTL